VGAFNNKNFHFLPGSPWPPQTAGRLPAGHQAAGRQLTAVRRRAPGRHAAKTHFVKIDIFFLSVNLTV